MSGMDRTQLLILLCCLSALSQAQAVNLSKNGKGEVLIFPYYSVNNDLNTIYQITNTTADAKAIKIRFLEGEGGLEVLNFNVYLSAYDVWSGILIPGTSTFDGHLGEPTAIHMHSDTSCAPYLSQSGQQFFPFLLHPDNSNMRRTTDGQIEVIEMGTLTGAAAILATHDLSGTPNGCSTLQAYWDAGGQWYPQTGGDPSIDIEPSTGGLTGTASLVDVANGYSYGFEAIALENFWLGDGEHSEPGSVYPNLAFAQTQAHVWVNGEIQASNWSTGYEAVSAVLMQSQIFNEFDFDDSILSKTEWVLTFPTKRFHVYAQSVSPPFANQWDGSASCEEFRIDMRDRNNRHFAIRGNPEPPPGYADRLCYQTNVIEFLADTSQFASTSQVLGSDNLVSFAPDNNFLNEYSGWSLIHFDYPTQTMIPQSGSDYLGLPAVGFKIQRITNNNAQLGLIAQYGRVAVHKGYTFNTPEVNTHE